MSLQLSLLGVDPRSMNISGAELRVSSGGPDSVPVPERRLRSRDAPIARLPTPRRSHRSAAHPGNAHPWTVVDCP